MSSKCRPVVGSSRMYSVRPVPASRQFFRQLDALCLSPAQRRRGLTQLDVSEADALQRAQLVGDGRKVFEQRQCLIDRQLEHVRDRLAAILNVERLAVVAPALALLARDVHIGQKVHLDRNHAVALAAFAAPAFHVEREAARPEPAGLRLGQHGEQLANEREQARVGGRIGARRPSDRRLIDLDHLVDVLDALDSVVCAGLVARTIQLARERSIENVVDQRRLSRTADSRYRHQLAQRDAHIDVLQVVLAGAANDEGALAARAPATRHRNRLFAAQVLPRQRLVSIYPLPLTPRPFPPPLPLSAAPPAFPERSPSRRARLRQDPGR